MTQHTPGPWTTSGDCYQEKGSWVVTIQSNNAPPEMNIAAEALSEHKEQAIANAHLIAAAPDLLEAAQACAEWLDLVKQNYPDMAGLIRGMEAARAAIAKATGERAAV